MGGGGGDGGYEERQRQNEVKKQQARDSLNAMFGYGGEAPTREQYMPQGARGGLGGVIDKTVGEAAVGAALPGATADWEARQGQAGATRNARDSLYQTVRDNAYTAGKRSLDEKRDDAQRNLKFELFARGLAGGSEDVDQNAKLGRTYNQGLMDLGGKADAAKAQFRNADEETRLQLLQSIDNGMDQGSALSAATNRMAIAADQAAADAQGTALGNVFDNAGLIYQQSQAAKGRQAATDWWNQYGNRGGGKPGASATGVSTRLPGEG